MNGEQEVGQSGEPRRERPILFSGPMVRAILEGKKTQTRRVVKHPEYYGCPTGDCPHETQAECNASMVLECPYGRVGDRLWVRETHWIELDGQGNERGVVYLADGAYYRDGQNVGHGATFNKRFRPSIHMPRWASRLTLEITEVRVQRLQEHSLSDLWAEGIDTDYEQYDLSLEARAAETRRVACAFRNLWDSINGKKPGCSWDADPWVWALTFQVAEVPVKAEPSQLVAISDIPSTEQEEERAGKHPGTQGQ